MQHARTTDTQEEAQVVDYVNIGPMPAVVLVADRTVPHWVVVFAALFQSASTICVLAIPILCTYLIALPDVAESSLAATLYGVVGLFLIVGSVVLDAAHNAALCGYRSQREATGIRTGFWLGALVALVLCAVHPLLALGPGVAVAIVVLVRQRWQRQEFEPMWEANHHEAAGFLSGRDAVGLALVTLVPESPALRASIIRAASWLALVLTFAVGSALKTSAVLSPESIPTLALLAFWATGAIAAYLLKTSEAGRTSLRNPPQVKALPEFEAATEVHGLSVQGLTVTNADGTTFLSDIRIMIEPGMAVGLIGGSGAGKSLLLRAMQDPFALDGLTVEGSVRLNRHDLWNRDAQSSAPISLLLPQQPLLLAASGLDNLTCCQPPDLVARPMRILERLVFSATDAAAICATRDARLLPGQQRKLLAFARALFMSPELYLMDRPEDGLSDQGIGALCEQISQERRLGRCFLIVTEDRAMLDLCDELIVMESGRIVDRGPSREIRQRMSTGWARLVADRRLESEENLRLWVRNLFKRPGDGHNQKVVMSIASELLAFSCQTVEGAIKDRLAFEFKHQKGHCLLRLIDAGDIPSSGFLQRARAEVERGSALSPLATVMKGAKTFECAIEKGRRAITLAIETYDPRETTSFGKTILSPRNG